MSRSSAARVHEHRDPLAHAPKRLHDALTNDCRGMIHAETAADVETRRKASPRANGG
jgi:putative transposase